MKAENAFLPSNLRSRVYFINEGRYPKGFNSFMAAIAPLIRTKHDFVNGFLRPKAKKHVRDKLSQLFRGIGNILLAIARVAGSVATLLITYLVILPVLLFIWLPITGITTLRRKIKGEAIAFPDALHVGSALLLIAEWSLYPLWGAMSGFSFALRGSIQVLTTPLALTIQPLWQWVLTRWKGGYRSFAEENSTQKLVNQGLKQIEGSILLLMNPDEKATYRGEHLSRLDKLINKKKKAEQRKQALDKFAKRLTEESASSHEGSPAFLASLKQYEQRAARQAYPLTPHYTLANVFNELVVKAHKSQKNGQAFSRDPIINFDLALEQPQESIGPTDIDNVVPSQLLNNHLRPKLIYSLLEQADGQPAITNSTSNTIRITLAEGEQSTRFSYKKYRLPEDWTHAYAFFKHCSKARSFDARRTWDEDNAELEAALRAVNTYAVTQL